MDKTPTALTPNSGPSFPTSEDIPSSPPNPPLSPNPLPTAQHRSEAIDGDLQSAHRLITELKTAKADAWHKCAQLKAESSRLRSAMKAMRLRLSLGWFSVLGVLTLYLVFVYSSKSTLAMELAKARAEATAATLRIAEADRHSAAASAAHALRLTELTNEFHQALQQVKTVLETTQRNAAAQQIQLAAASKEIAQSRHLLAQTTPQRPNPATPIPPSRSSPPAIPAAATIRDHALTNSLGMRFVRVPGTKVSFSIWETRVADFRAFVAATQHDATTGVASLAKDHWKARGDTWMSPGFSYRQAEDHPVVGVSWNDAQAFCQWLSRKENRKYRLPTDAEWSAAAGDGKYVWGNAWPPKQGTGNFAGEEVQGSRWPDDYPVIPGYRDDYAWTSPVDSFGANSLGLFNLAGNVAEWCEDWYRSTMNTPEILRLYPDLAADSAAQKYRVLRGGSWADDDRNYLLSAFRYGSLPEDRDVNVGFRVVLTEGTIN